MEFNTLHDTQIFTEIAVYTIRSRGFWTVANILHTMPCFQMLKSNQTVDKE